jgi:hypothetical protein
LRGQDDDIGVEESVGN